MTLQVKVIEQYFFCERDIDVRKESIDVRERRIDILVFYLVNSLRQKHITSKRISRSQSWALLERATSQSEFTS